tara:strand:+ start:1028 stop:1306 length:279 start_codon:yes stop_codon:yes gene_type:complete
MPNGFDSLIGQIVNGFALVGFSAIFVTIFWFLDRKKKKNERPRNASEGVFASMLRRDIDERAKIEREAISEAKKSTNPADELAKIANERRGR